MVRAQRKAKNTSIRLKNLFATSVEQEKDERKKMNSSLWTQMDPKYGQLLL